MSNFVIQKDQTNNVVLTLSERSSLTNPYYLFVFTSKFSTDKDEKKLSIQDSAIANIRYNLLEIVEQINPDPLNGEIFLIEGEWSYKVYESLTQTLLVEETTGDVLQRGFIIVE